MATRRSSRARAGPGAVTPPTAEQHSDLAVNREVLKRVSLHPAFVLPAAGGAATLAFSAVAGLTPVGAAIAIGCFFVSASAWTVNYLVFGPGIGAKYRRRLVERAAEAKSQELEGIEVEFKAAKFKAGHKEAKELTAAYHKLRATLETRGREDLQAREFLALLNEAYGEAVGVLRQALALFVAVKTVDIDSIEEELTDWEAQLEEIDSGRTAEREALERNIRAHTERRENYRRRKEQIDDLIARANEIEGIMESASLDASDISVDVSPMYRPNGAASRLKVAITAVKTVQQRSLNRGLDLNEIDRQLNADHPQDRERERQ